MERNKFLIRKKILPVLACMMMSLVMWFWTGVDSYAEGVAQVKVEEGRIREAADKTSKTLASVKKGDKLDALAETTDSEGYTWYKVRIDAEDVGYIRADLVSLSGSVSVEKASSGTSSSSTKNDTSSDSSSSNKSQQTEAAKTEVVAVTVSETDVLSVKSLKSSNIRKGAGTNFDTAGGVKENITMSVSGVAMGSDGKNWYQVTLSENNTTITGFIREDLVEIVEQKAEEEAPVEEIPVEEEAAEETENKDYELRYMANNSGEMDWYLFNNIEGTSMSLTQMLSVIDQVKNKELQEDEQIGNMRLIIIALAVVIAVLVAAVVFLVFKLRYGYEEYEEYEDEEEDEEEEEEEAAPARGMRRLNLSLGRRKHEEAEEDDSEEEAVITETKKKAERNEGRRERKVPMSEQTVGEPEAPKSENRSWQSKDFLELDDDMEFEFLDL